MTDKDIIKALECCASVDDGCLTDCPLYDGDDSCFSTLLKPILDLINRQQAEIEKLQDRYNRLCKHTEKIEFELGEKELDNSWFNNPNTHLIAPVTRKIKAEAIKEFAERLKGKICDSFGFVRHGKGDIDIDNLVKEMVGDTE